MHLALMALMFLAALPPDPSAPPLDRKVPLEGRWFASTTVHGTGWGPNVFSIVHLTPQGLDVVFKTTAFHPNEYAWADSDTLVVLEGFESPLKLRWFDAGKPTYEVDLPATVWPAGTTVSWPELGTLVDGTAVLVNCLEPSPSPAKCKRRGVLLVTREGVVTASKKLPRGVQWPSTDGVAPKPVKRPEGYTATLTKVDIDGQRIKGVTCQSPISNATWPTANTINWEFALRPDKVTWIDDDPPIFMASGIGTNPIAERWRGHVVFRACSAEPIQHYRVLGDGLWLSGEDVVVDQVIATTYWTLWSNGQALARIQGDASLVVMAPH